jgi:hypothetical protein
MQLNSTSLDVITFIPINSSKALYARIFTKILDTHSRIMRKSVRQKLIKTGKYKPDVHESVHRDTIMKMTNKMHYIDYSKSTLHISGNVFAHHQEHLAVFTVSGSIHPIYRTPHNSHTSVSTHR